MLDNGHQLLKKTQGLERNGESGGSGKCKDRRTVHIRSMTGRNPTKERTQLHEADSRK